MVNIGLIVIHYRPQSINDNNFNKDFIDAFDKISTLGTDHLT